MNKNADILAAMTHMMLANHEDQSDEAKARREAQARQSEQARVENARLAKERYEAIAAPLREERARRKAEAWAKRQPKPSANAALHRHAQLVREWRALASSPLTDARPCIVTFPDVSQDGDQVCLSWGHLADVDSVAGFGPTLLEAAKAFDEDFYSKFTLTVSSRFCDPRTCNETCGLSGRYGGAP